MFKKKEVLPRVLPFEEVRKLGLDLINIKSNMLVVGVIHLHHKKGVGAVESGIIKNADGSYEIETKEHGVRKIHLAHNGEYYIDISDQFTYSILGLESEDDEYDDELDENEYDDNDDE